MKIKGIQDVDFVNYKKISMFIAFPYCTFKCDKENGCNLCQNSELVHQPTHDLPIPHILKLYKNNPLTKAIVCGGLEPFDSAEELLQLVTIAREDCEIKDDIVIYTGYTEEELNERAIFQTITDYDNIVIKFGRFRPNEEKHFDEELGVWLASNNQYAVRYNNA